MKHKNQKLIIFIGPPGAGKGLYSDSLLRNHNLSYFGTGNEMRKYSEEQSDFGKYIQSFIQSGKLVPDELIIQVFEKKMETVTGDIIIDGFPRTIAQQNALKKAKKKHHQIIVFSLLCSPEISLFRIAGRLACPACSASYHRTLNPPKMPMRCDFDNNSLVVRTDINQTKDRLEIYIRDTLPTVEAMKKYPNVFEVYEIDTESGNKKSTLQLLEKILGYETIE